MNSEPESPDTPQPGRENAALASQVVNAGSPVPTPVVLKLPSLWRRSWPVALLLSLLGLGGLLLWQHNLITDWIALRSYSPPATIQKLTQDDTMTSYARRLFYVNKPQIDGRAVFNQNCSNGHDQVTVLGCYAGNRQGIYLYDVTDPRLAGIQQVTAAHETLHQAYDRLSSSDRKHVDDLLTAYAKTITDPGLKAKLAIYQKIEPHDVVNEMHSVFGTEVTNLPPELEQYYTRYFTDRHKITQFHDQYQAAFTQRQQQIDSYTAQIESLRKQIDTDKTAISVQEKALQTQRSQLDAYAASSQITAYNAAVPGFNSQVDAYKALITQTNFLIDQYNKLIDARNAITIQEQQLQQAIDSHATSANKQ
jgi:hypothetical protein